MSTNKPIWPKKIEWDLLDFRRRDTDKKNTQKNKSDKLFLVPPISSPIDNSAINYALIADFLKRTDGGLLKISNNPVLQNIDSSTPDIIWNTRQKDFFALSTVLDKLSIFPDTLYTTSNISDVLSIHDCTKKLFNDHQLAPRWDVCYYNIYTATAVPDHRVVHKITDVTRYHIRFFFLSKNDTIVAVIDDPSLLFASVAILVHPQDKRYKKFVGKEVLIPLINKSIPILAHESIDLEGYGTRLLIPAHNRQDFSLALELGLPYNISSVDQYGKYTKVAKEFEGKHKDEFESNIIQFIQDIANLEKKEQVKGPIPVDAVTGDILLPLLQKNIYLFLSDGSLKDASLVSTSQFIGQATRLEEEIETEEQRCISSYDITQTRIPFDIQNKTDSIQITLSIWYHIIKDIYLLDLISFPAKGESIVQGLLFNINNQALWEVLLISYTGIFSEKEISSVKDILLPISTSISDDYVLSLDSFFLILDTIPDLHYTEQGYLLNEQSFFRYDHEYVSTLMLLKENKLSNIVALYDEKNCYWLKHFVYLYNKINKELLTNVSFVSIQTPTSTANLQAILDSYPGDVIRMSQLLHISLTSSVSLEHSFQLYTNDYIYRFLTKWRNSLRVIYSNKLVYDFSNIESILDYIKKFEKEFSEYDIRIITKIRYVSEELSYYVDKYAFDQATKFVIDSLWYDVSERTLFILKFAPSKHTQFLGNFVAYISCHLLYPFAPITSLGALSFIGLPLQRSKIKELFSNIDLKKNYKCNLMMDAMMEWDRIICSKKNTKYALCMQANKDFSDYIQEHRDFVVEYFSGLEKVDFFILSELDSLPQGWIGKDFLTMKIGVVFQENSSKETTLAPIVSISVLQGQLAYKKQLLQTVKNTIMRIRTLKEENYSVEKLQSDLVVIQKEIDQLEYQVSKMKYF